MALKRRTQFLVLDSSLEIITGVVCSSNIKLANGVTLYLLMMLQLKTSLN